MMGGALLLLRRMTLTTEHTLQGPHEQRESSAPQQQEPHECPELQGVAEDQRQDQRGRLHHVRPRIPAMEAIPEPLRGGAVGGPAGSAQELTEDQQRRTDEEESEPQ